MQRRRLMLGLGAVCATASLGARAQGLLARPVTVFCAYPAGGPTDQVMRALAEVAARRLGQPVVVENRPGASGTRAALGARIAPPDGHTLAQMPMGVFRIPHMQKSPSFDPIADFSYVINLVGYTFGLVVRSDSPLRSIPDLVEWARANPERFNWGSPGVGTSAHLAFEEFASRAAVRLNHVAFKGSPDMLQAVLGGHIDGASDTTGWAPHVESGRLRLLATFGSRRSRRWPDVPTLRELGYETVSDSPLGIAGPAGIDPRVVEALHDAFRAGLQDAGVLRLLERLDLSVVYMGPAEYAAWAKSTYAAERATIARLGLAGSI